MLNGKKETTIVLVVCSMLILIGMLVLACSNSPSKQDYSEHYDVEVIEGNFIVINDKINVRSEPLVTEQYYTAYAGSPAGAAGYGIKTISVNTSYGKVKADSLYLAVSGIYYPVNCCWDDCSMNGGDAFNGPFIGIAVKDITAMDNWKKYFPKNIEKDPDGIVWVSLRMDAVKYGTVSFS